MSARLNAVREACRLDPELRTEEHVNDIVEFVKDVKFFTKLTGLQQRALCRTMTHEVFGPREYIFQKDEIGDKFYIIVAGSVSVQIPSSTQCPNGIHQERCDCPNRPLETVVHLEQGMGFGELALQSDQPRSATIQTSEITETLVTKRTDYEQYAGQLHRQFIEQRVRFLRQFPRIEDALQRCLVSTQDIAAMANCLSETSYSGNEMVVWQGDPVESMIFVRKGQLAMLRLVDLDNLSEANGEPCEEAPARFQRPGQAAEAATLGEATRPSTSEGRSVSRGAAQDRDAWATALANSMMEERRRLAEEPALLPPDPAAPAGRSPGVTAFLARHREQQPPGEAAARGARPKRGPERARGSAWPRQDGDSGSRARCLWRRLRVAWRTACIINRLKPVDGRWVSDASGQDSGMHHVAQMLDVSAARTRYAEFRSRELSHKRVTRKKASIVAQSTSAGNARRLLPHASRRRLLRIGTVAAFQHIGDRQVVNGGAFPVSLVSDPIAEVYFMSKHDIQRRLPKKLFSALFMPDKEEVPNDVNILELHRQGERWGAFRRGLHGEAALARARARGPSGALARRDEASKLGFLGVAAPKAPRSAGALTGRDEVLFGQASAAFLRKFEFLRRDPELRRGLLKEGVARRQPLLLYGEEDEADPSAFRFERNWAKLGKFSGLDPMEPAPAALLVRQRASPLLEDSLVMRNSPLVSAQLPQQLVGRPSVSRGSMPPSVEKGGVATMTCSTELPPLSSARSLAISTHTTSYSVVGPESARKSRRRPGALAATA